MMVRDAPILAAIAAAGAFVALKKPLDPGLVLQVAYTLGILNGVITLLSPSKAAQLYGVKSTPLNEMALERMGMITLSTHAMAFCLFKQGTSVNTAIGVCASITTLVMLKSLLNEEPKKLGFAPAPHYGVFLIAAINAYTCLTESDYADMTIKLLVLRGFGHGVSMSFFPGAMAKSYAKMTADASMVYCVKLLGVFALANGFFIAALHFDNLVNTAQKAYAWSWVPALVIGVIGHFLKDDTSKTGTRPWPKFAWMLLQVTMVATFLV